MDARHIYVHVPFCARRCSYCDFSIAVRRQVPAAAFSDSVRSEIDRRYLVRRHGEIDTLYLGGGTPSRLGADGVRRLMGVLLDRFPLASAAEVTLEANPEDVTGEAVEAWSLAGVTRVSLGVQSFDDRVLTWMHRVHSAAEAVRAAQIVRDHGIASISLDLIYALPSSVPREWERDLECALSLQPRHLSCYGLTVEPRTPLARWAARGELSPASEEAYERDFLVTDAVLTGAGYEHYEVSNYSLPGHRAVHNSAYWAGEPYIGLGPAAHGFTGTKRRWNLRHLSAWESALAAGIDPVEGEETLSLAQREMEEVYLGLRSSGGLATVAGDDPLIRRWCSEGWGEVRNGRLYLSPMGWLRLDAIAATLTEHRSRY